MKPYLIEGLDCSGKKTTAALVVKYFQSSREGSVKCYIGPLVPTPLQWLDQRLANIRHKVERGKWIDILRRTVYIAGPIVDGVFFRAHKSYSTVKISSHYRAQARASIEHDTRMLRWFEWTSGLSLAFGGCTYLTVPFDVRIDRHRRDAAAGKTMKVESVRFLDYDRRAFEEWDLELQQLLFAKIKYVQTVSTEQLSSEEVAQRVAQHIIFCRNAGVI